VTQDTTGTLLTLELEAMGLDRMPTSCWGPVRVRMARFGEPGASMLGADSQVDDVLLFPDLHRAVQTGRGQLREHNERRDVPPLPPPLGPAVGHGAATGLVNVYRGRISQ